MNVQLNKHTSVTVESGLTKFRTAKNKQDDFIVLRNDKTYSVNIRTKRQFLFIRFLILFGVGLLGGLGHYLYDTQFLGYNPNPPIIGAIVAVFTIIGLAISFAKNRVFTVVMDDRTKYKTFVIPIDKDVNQEELEQLLDILTIIPVEQATNVKPTTNFVESISDFTEQPPTPITEPSTEDLEEDSPEEPEEVLLEEQKDEPEDVVEEEHEDESLSDEEDQEEQDPEQETDPIEITPVLEKQSIPEGVIEALVHVENNEYEPTNDPEEEPYQELEQKPIEEEPISETNPQVEEVTALDINPVSSVEVDYEQEPESDEEEISVTEPEKEEHTSHDEEEQQEMTDQPKEVIIEHIDITKELYKYSVAQLRDIAKSQGMKNYTKYRKADLIDFMIEHDVQLPGK